MPEAVNEGPNARNKTVAGRPSGCSREESNLHGFPHTVLSRTRLPFRHVSVAPGGLKVARRRPDRKRQSAPAPFARPRFNRQGLAVFA